jgi:hypothetical protein
MLPISMRFFRRYAIALLRAADVCVKATDPPKGPAAAPLRTRATQTLLTPATVASQVIPAGILICMSNSVLVASEMPWTPRPGTSLVTSAFWKAASEVPPEVPSTSAVKGPAPSWLIWSRVSIDLWECGRGEGVPDGRSCRRCRPSWLWADPR